MKFEPNMAKNIILNTNAELFQLAVNRKVFATPKCIKKPTSFMILPCPCCGSLLHSPAGGAPRNPAAHSQPFGL